MRIQIIELPTQNVGDAYESPYLLVVSEVPAALDEQTYQSIRANGKEAFDHCAGVFLSTEPVQVGPESAYEMQLRLGAAQEARVGASLADWEAGVSEMGIVEKLAQDGLIPARVVNCPERAKKRGCACLVGAEDCPTEDGALVVPVEGKTAEEIVADAQAAAEQLVDRQADAELAQEALITARRAAAEQLVDRQADELAAVPTVHWCGGLLDDNGNCTLVHG